mgnify:CR=1 FL=1
MNQSQNSDNTLQISITTRTIIKAVFIIALLFVAYKFVGHIAATIQLIVISAFLAMGLNPAVSWLSKKMKGAPGSRVWATAAAYVVVLSLLIGLIAIFVPPLVRQAYDVANEIPTTVQDIENQQTPMVSFIRNNGFAEQYAQLVSSIQNNLQELGQRLLSAISTIGSALISIVTVLVLVFMMLIEGPAWIKKFWEMHPKEKVARRREVANKMYRMVTGYINGQLLIATIAATFAMVAMLIMRAVFNVDINIVPLVLIVGLVGLVPMIGNTLAAAIIVVVCLFVSLPMAIGMGIFFLVYQQIENATLQPYIQSKYNELTPLTVFVAALIGVAVAGFLGALVAIPIAGCVRILLTEVYGDKIDKLKKA